jgi:hypothetical protein
MISSVLRGAASQMLLQQGSRAIATQAMLAAGQKVRLPSQCPWEVSGQPRSPLPGSTWCQKGRKQAGQIPADLPKQNQHLTILHHHDVNVGAVQMHLIFPPLVMSAGWLDRSGPHGQPHGEASAGVGQQRGGV